MQFKDQLEDKSSGYQQKSKFNQSLWRLLPLLALLAVVLVFFAKTVFLGLPISKICRLAEWDSIFSQYSTGYSTRLDPSLIQLLVPSFFLIAKLWHTGHIPLWNPYSGFGAPLLADIQLRALSPLNIPLFVFPQMRTYNLMLVMHVLLAVIGAFALARSFSLSRLASIFSALAYGLCPYLLWYSEWIGNDYALLPFLFLFFVRMADVPNLRRIVIAAIACVCVLTSSHPELSFFNIVFAGVLALLTMLFKNKQELSSAASRRNRNLRKQVINFAYAMRTLASSALLTLLLAAPLLLQFIELMQNADSCRFGPTTNAHLPWQALFYNLIQPGFHAASPYLGLVAFMCLILALAHLKPQFKSVAITLVIASIVLTATGPMAYLMQIKPFSYVMPLYCLSVVLLLLSLLAGSGFDLLTAEQLSMKKIVTLVSAGLLILLVPTALHLLHVPLTLTSFDQALPEMAIDWHFWQLSLGILLLSSLLIAVTKVFPSRYRWLIAIGLIACNFASQGSVARASLSVQPKFDYTNTETLSFLEQHPARIITIGNHIFKPESNIVYGIYNLQCFNALFPQRFLKFAKFCGAEIGQYSQTFSNQLSPYLDLASVKYVVSIEPVYGQDDKSEVLATKSIGHNYGAIQIVKAEYAYDARNADILGNLYLQTNQPQRFSYSMVLLDRSGNPIWFSDQKEISNLCSAHNYCQSFASPVTLKLPTGKGFSLAVQIFDKQYNKFLSVDKSGITTYVIADLVSGSSSCPQPAYRHYKLIDEAANFIRIYENQNALPAAYLVHHVLLAQSADDVFSLLSRRDFNPRQSAVIEASIGSWLANLIDTKAESVKIIRTDNNTVVVKLQSKQAGVLVLTDMIYPGWKAFLDGKEVPILHANYAFRAVVIPAGAHVVEFKYWPFQFLLGLSLSAITLIILASIFAWRWYQSSLFASTVKINRV